MTPLIVKEDIPKYAKKGAHWLRFPTSTHFVMNCLDYDTAAALLDAIQDLSPKDVTASIRDDRMTLKAPSKNEK